MAATNQPRSAPGLARRDCLAALAGALSLLAWPGAAGAQRTHVSFEQWVAHFRPRARARGVSEATYARVMTGLKPDTSVYDQVRNQPEFTEQLWQYLNRRVSDWRIVTRRARAEEYATLFTRIERDFGVPRAIMLGIWGIESAYGDPLVQAHHMRPVIPALAALALGRAAPARLLGTGASQRAPHH